MKPPDITETLLKVALITITHTHTYTVFSTCRSIMTSSNLILSLIPSIIYKSILYIANAKPIYLLTTDS